MGKNLNRVEGRRDEEIATLCEFLLATYGADVVGLQLHAPKYTTTVSDRPMVSPLSRLQARQGGYLTSIRHTMIDVKDALSRRLIMSLDGTRDRASLLQELTEVVKSGGLSSEPTGLQPEALDAAVSLEMLEQKLVELSRLALLVA